MHSSDKEDDLGELRTLIAQVEALEKEQTLHEAGLGNRGNTSAPAPPEKSHRKGKGEHLRQYLSPRVSGLEGLVGPTQPAPGATQRADQAQVGTLPPPALSGVPAEGAQLSAGEILHGDSSSGPVCGIAGRVLLHLWPPRFRPCMAGQAGE